MNESKDNFSNLFISFSVLFVTLLFFSQVMGNYVIKPRLYDGTLNGLGRYSFSFDAYEYIEENSEKAIIAIGSSKMREIFDGELIGEYTISSGDFYNLAYAGDTSYVRMIEIDSIIKSEPVMVILELGPNTFTKGDTPIKDLMKARMSLLMSLNPEWRTASWEENLDENDKQLLPLSRNEQLEFFAEHTSESIEKSMNYYFEDWFEVEEYKNFFETPPYSCDRNTGTVHCVPHKESQGYDLYVKYPIQFRNSLKVIKEGKAKWTIEEFYGENLDNYLKRSYHNPEGVLNKNQIAYEFMIQKLLENNIEVVLVGVPYNPVLIDRLSEGQWDYYNSTVSGYKNNSDITVIDYLWDKSWIDDDFNDYAHAARDGEIKFAEKIAPALDELLVNI